MKHHLKTDFVDIKHKTQNIQRRSSTREHLKHGRSSHSAQYKVEAGSTVGAERLYPTVHRISQPQYLVPVRSSVTPVAVPGTCKAQALTSCLLICSLLFPAVSDFQLVQLFRPGSIYGGICFFFRLLAWGLLAGGYPHLCAKLRRVGVLCKFFV